MKVTITMKNKKDFELNKDKLERIKKILPGNVEIQYKKTKGVRKNKLSSLSGILSIGGNSLKDSEKIND